MRHLVIWQSAVFLLNSRLGLFAAARGGPVSLAPRASLLPRLRDDFAEFLNVVSLAHLGLLDVSVSQLGTLLPLRSLARLPTVLSVPSNSSVTVWEETAPVKLTPWHCPAAR